MNIFGWITPKRIFVETEPFNHLKGIAENEAFDDEIKEKSRQMTSDLEEIEIDADEEDVKVYEMTMGDYCAEIIELCYKKNYIRVGSLDDTIHFELSQNALNRHMQYCKDFAESRDMKCEFKVRVIIKKEIKMKLTPMNENVLIAPMKEKSKTDSGIIVVNPKELHMGKVVEIAEDEKELKRGDIVRFGQFSGHEITHESVDYMIINRKDILCKIESE